jgi:chromosomal replication initiation ATPase DnaA
LRSRLLASPAVAVEPPDDALLSAVLVKLFADRQLRVSEDVINYLLLRLERSFAAAQEIVAALDRAALADQRAVTVPLARETLSRMQDRDRD